MKLNHFKFIIMYIATVLMSYGAGIIWQLDFNHLISMVVMAGIGNAFVIFSYYQEKLEASLLYDNHLYEMRFVTVYFISYIVAMAFPLLPSTSWFFPVIAVTLMIFSNRYIGLIGSTFLLLQTILLVGEGAEVFALFFVTNIAVLFAFRYLNEQFEIVRPIMISVLIQLTMTTAMIIMFANEPLSVSLFAIPIMNVFLTTLLLLVILKQFSTLIVYKYHSRYMTINDQTFPLMMQLKEQSLKTYLAGIHTAYLAERIGHKVTYNQALVKAVSYYGQIGVLLEGDMTEESLKSFLKPYEFPTEVQTLILELQNTNLLLSKEATVVTVCRELIQKIGEARELNEMSEKKVDTLDYSTIIRTYLKESYQAGRFAQCELTLCDYKEMEQILIGEGLYYDFLY